MSTKWTKKRDPRAKLLFFFLKPKAFLQFSLLLPSSFLRACLHEGGGPQVGEVTWGGLPHLTCKRDHIKMRDYMDRRVTPPKRVTSPIWGTLPSCKQALKLPIKFQRYQTNKKKPGEAFQSVSATFSCC